MTLLLPKLVRIAASALALAAAGAQAQPRDLLPSITRGSIALNLVPVSTGLAAPDYGISAPGDASRLYVVEQGGQLRVLLDGVLQPGPALDISSRLGSSFVPTNANDERGLLGLAFHPDFNKPAAAGFRTLYTFNTEPIPAGTSPTYVAPNNATQNFKTVVNEWKMPTLGTVDPGSRREVISFGKNANNHNGGTITFGKDGYLYLALGDGGNANDVGASHIEPGGNAQNPTTPLGKMLRLDPLNPALTAGSTNPISANGQYRIPDNTKPGSSIASVVPEEYARGFRNPYRFSVDRGDPGGRIIVADVGQGSIEEINLLAPGGNYGWAIKEGDFEFNRVPGGANGIGARSPGSPSGLIDPISGPLGTLQYDHQDGISITGGFVYRGSAIPALFGKYVFGDLALRNAPPRVDGRLFYADLDTGLIQEFLLPSFATASNPDGSLPNGLTVHGFGEDAAGELYAMVTNTPASGSGGIVYMLSPVPEPATLAMWGAGGLLLLARLRRRRGFARTPVP